MLLYNKLTLADTARGADQYRRIIVIFAFLVFAGFLLVSLYRSNSYAMDETVYHFPNVLNFYRNGLGATFNKAYSAANTPLPYIIVAAVSKIFTPSIPLARIVTAVFSFFTFLTGMKILARLNVKPVYSLILLFYPYFFLNSFVFYVSNFGMFFFLVALLLLISAEKNYLFDLGIGISISLAILCQQFYLMVLGAILLKRLSEYVTERKTAGSLQYFITSCFLICLPVLVPLAVFYKWGGLVHENFKVHALSFFPTNFTGIFFVTGFYFFPFVIQFYQKADWWKLLLSLAGGTILSIWYKPGYSDFNGPGIFNGIVFHLIKIVADRSMWLGTALMIFLSGTGILLFYKLAETRKSVFERTLFAGGLFLIAAYVMNAIIGERHLLPLLFLLFFIILPRLKPGILKTYMPAMTIFGVGYYVFWLFVKYK